MTRSFFFRSVLSFSFVALSAGLHPAFADSSHARVIRLSIVEGDVRFTREAHGDPLADQKAVWETAQANLPIRQGYVVATDKGRAEVEFENGAVAFLSENTVLDFYDLSLDDGARTTRLVLRQGSASFYVNPSNDDYFSVTGGDFTVEAAGKGSFRINNFDDGSNVSVVTGRISVLHKKQTTPLSKGQSLSMQAGDDAVAIGRLPVDDDFDHWVSGRIDTVSSATKATQQYTYSANYVPGFPDLYTYGAWFECGGYGYGWRPFGAGSGWYPYSNGQWNYDPGFGWTWISYQPWGWSPYHYGGWLFDASCGGWFYSPPIYYGVIPGAPGKRPRPIVHPPRPVYHASTAVFVRQNGKLGVVPRNPLDKDGKTPLNLSHGVFSTESTSRLMEPVAVAAGQPKWETVKSPAHDVMNSGLAPTTAPPRASRTLIEGSSGTRVVSLGENSSIVYDPRTHRFVNTNVAPRASANSGLGREKDASSPRSLDGVLQARENKTPVTPPTVRAVSPPTRTIPPPPAPRYSGGGSYRGGGSEYAGGGASRGSSAPASAPHASAPASGGGGGRPH